MLRISFLRLFMDFFITIKWKGTLECRTFFKVVDSNSLQISFFFFSFFFADDKNSTLAICLQYMLLNIACVSVHCTIPVVSGPLAKHQKMVLAKNAS